MRDRYASLRDGLVGAWIPSISGSGLLLPDLSGQGNNGALTNMGPEDWVSSQYGRALDFDGVDDYVRINKSDFGVEKTIHFWVKFKSSKNQWVINNRTQANSTVNFQLFQYLSSDFRVLARNSTGSEAIQITLWDVTQYIGIWKHVAVAFSTNTMFGFVDGVSVGSVSFSSGQFANSSSAIFQLGDAWSTELDARFDGQLDDIRIYNRVLSEPQIKLLASRPGIGLRPQRRSMYYAPPTGARRRRILTSMP